MESALTPHDDVLVISAIAVNLEIKRILVDDKSAANMLSHEAFTKIEISVYQLKTIKTPLQGFGGRVITPEGVVKLSLTLSSDKR